MARGKIGAVRRPDLRPTVTPIQVAEERHHCHLCNMESSMRAEDFQIPSFLADLNAPLGGQLSGGQLSGGQLSY